MACQCAKVHRKAPREQFLISKRHFDHILARFGTLSDITLDRGAQFTSKLWTAVAGSLGMNRTTAYNAQANRLCERFHHSMKAALRTTLTDSNWIDHLRFAPKKDLQFSSAELVFGQPLRVPVEFLPRVSASWPATVTHPAFREAVRVFTLVPVHHCLPQSYVPKDLLSARFVFICHDAHRSLFWPSCDGPSHVLEA